MWTPAQVNPHLSPSTYWDWLLRRYTGELMDWCVRLKLRMTSGLGLVLPSDGLDDPSDSFIITLILNDHLNLNITVLTWYLIWTSFSWLTNHRGFVVSQSCDAGHVTYHYGILYVLPDVLNLLLLLSGKQRLNQIRCSLWWTIMYGQCIMFPI